MSSPWIWAKSDTPPKCKLDKWQKRSRVAQAEAFIQTFYRPTFVQPLPAEPQVNSLGDFSSR